MFILEMLNYTELQWILLVAAALMVGFSKTGIGGIMMLIIPIFASTFGGKESTGVILPMLLAGDVFAVWYYHRHAEWSNIKKLVPWALAGIISGAVVGNYINDVQFKTLIASLVIICLGILLYMEKKGDSFKVPEKPWFFALTGAAAGFASMIGNAAGPIFSIYLLAKGFKKNDYMGTSAWFFLIVNLSKLPFQIFYWKNVNANTALTMATMLPVIAAGAFIGIAVIKKLNEKPFRYLILAMTAISAVRLFM